MRFLKTKKDFYNIPYGFYSHDKSNGDYSPLKDVQMEGLKEEEFKHHWRLERPSLGKVLYQNGLQKITKTYTQNWEKYFGSGFYIEFQSHLPTSMRKYIK